MLEGITEYIKFLNREYNLAVSVHYANATAGGLAPYNIHRNPYCMYVKSSRECWEKCRLCQEAAVKKCGEGAFFGSCFSGMGEFVIPIETDKGIIGFISISGYEGSREKMKHFAEKYGFVQNRLEACYNENTKRDIPDIKFIRTLVQPLAAMLALMYMKEPHEKTFADTHEYIYSHVILILETEYEKKISIEYLAKRCHCGKSLISRVFRENTGKTVGEYLEDIRIKHAKKLLKESSLSISDIADLCGFSDSNYFIYVFGKSAGMPPGRYRKAHTNNNAHQ